MDLKLSAKNLKEVLWETLKGIKSGDVNAQDSEAIASQSREIVRVLRAQQSVIKQANEKITKEMLEFVGDES